MAAGELKDSSRCKEYDTGVRNSKGNCRFIEEEGSAAQARRMSRLKDASEDQESRATGDRPAKRCPCRIIENSGTSMTFRNLLKPLFQQYNQVIQPINPQPRMLVDFQCLIDLAREQNSRCPSLIARCHVIYRISNLCEPLLSV